jgi:hypothetical protein
MRLRRLLLAETALVLVLTVATPFWPILRSLWVFVLILGLVLGYIGLRSKATPVWILGGLVMPMSVGVYGAGWTLGEKWLPAWVAAVAAASFAMWAIRRVGRGGGLIMTRSLLQRVPSWRIVIVTLVALGAALLAQGVFEDFSLGFPFHLLNGSWAVVVGGIVALGERLLGRFSEGVALPVRLFPIATLSCSGASLIFWVSYAFLSQPWLLWLLGLICVIGAALGIVAISVGRLRTSRPAVALGWAGIGGLFVLCGGNIWFTVLDPSGAPVPRANIRVGGENLKTNSDGSVALPFAPYCALTITTSASGFKTTTYRDIGLPFLFPKRSVIMLTVGNARPKATVETPNWIFFPAWRSYPSIFFF